jgi:LysR family transcriptional activator of nhaA
VGEFEDSALLKVFGRAGAGLFAASSVIAEDVVRQFDVVPLGALDGIREQFFAVSVERRLRHPAVVAVTQTARNVLFG